MYIHVPYENWRFPNWLKSHLSLAPPFINTMYVTTWPISKRGNKWEMLSYEAWTDGRTAVCHNKPLFWRVYTNEWPISWNYEYIIFGQIIFQNFHQFKAFVGLSDRRTIWLSDYSYGPDLNTVISKNKLEAQWAEPVSLDHLSFCFEETLYSTVHRCFLPNVGSFVY